MILFTNGCSWTHFSTLNFVIPDEQERRVAVWPYRLGNFLQAKDIINLADGCGSNQRIVRTTYNWLRSQTPENLAQTTAVIQLTEWSRFELYSPLSNEKNEDMPGQWVKCKVGIVNEDSFNPAHWDEKEMREIADMRLSQTHHIEDVYRNIGYLFALKGMFEAYGVKKWYLWHQGGPNGWNEIPMMHKTELASKFNILDLNDHWSYEKLSKLDSHPSMGGHITIARNIYDLIR